MDVPVGLGSRDSRHAPSRSSRVAMVLRLLTLYDPVRAVLFVIGRTMLLDRVVEISGSCAASLLASRSSCG